MTHSPNPVAVARSLYDALNAHDTQAIMGVLEPEFVGVTSDGLPVGAGRHEGAAAMLRECWGPVFARFDIGVHPEEFLATADDRVVVTGRYRGVERATGRCVDAGFAHVLRVNGPRVGELVQYTDTARWGIG